MALVILVAVPTVLILHRVHLRLSDAKNNNPGRVENDDRPTRHPDTPSPTAYDDILVFPQQESPKEIRAIDTDIVTTCNEAYGATPGTSNEMLSQTQCTSKANCNITEGEQMAAAKKCTNVVYENFESASLERSNAYNNPIDIQSWLGRDVGTEVRGNQNEGDDGPDYANLVPPDHLFGEYVQPEFVRPSSSAELQPTLKTVEYAELKGYPLSGRMATSRSLPDIIDQLDKDVRSKQKSWREADQIRISLPIKPMSNRQI